MKIKSGYFTFVFLAIASIVTPLTKLNADDLPTMKFEIKKAITTAKNEWYLLELACKDEKLDPVLTRYMQCKELICHHSFNSRIALFQGVPGYYSDNKVLIISSRYPQSISFYAAIPPALTEYYTVTLMWIVTSDNDGRWDICAGRFDLNTHHQIGCCKL
jgi:hypothetical protein